MNFLTFGTSLHKQKHPNPHVGAGLGREGNKLAVGSTNQIWGFSEFLHDLLS